MKLIRIAAVASSLALLAGCATAEPEPEKGAAPVPAAVQPLEGGELVLPAELTGLWRSGRMLLHFRRDGSAVLRSFSPEGGETECELDLRMPDPAVPAYLQVRSRSVSAPAGPDSGIAALLPDSGAACWRLEITGGEPAGLRIYPMAREAGPEAVPPEEPAAEPGRSIPAVFHRELVD